MQDPDAGEVKRTMALVVISDDRGFAPLLSQAADAGLLAVSVSTDRHGAPTYPCAQVTCCHPLAQLPLPAFVVPALGDRTAGQLAPARRSACCLVPTRAGADHV